MDTIIIDERIDVGAVFKKNIIKPRWFVWKGRKYAITEVTYTWEDTQGAARVMHFALSDGNTLFEVSLNLTSLEWRLEKSSVV
ncbi:MAG: DUF6504 family protein [Elusimicrobia bacterium]|nr:DUF6504 family protein [Elusimicrobiota bacterium]